MASCTPRKIFTCSKRRGMPYATFLSNVLAIAEELHDEKHWEHARPLFLSLNEHITCYHVIYRLGIYKWEGWATDVSRAAGGKLWQEAKTLMADLVDTEPLAAFDMGVLWDRGFPDQDFRMAIKYYEIASRGGNAKAKFNIALMYKRGEGVIPSNEDSALYMEDAAMHGHRQAMLSMAKFYTKGIGCKKDGSAALRFYKMAVEKWRDECASNKIASWYGKGKHVPKDFRTAIKYNTKKAITQKYWEPVWTEVWPQMLLLQAVLVQEEESPLHELPRELIELFWSTLVDVYFYQKEQLMWEEPEEPDFDFF